MVYIKDEEENILRRFLFLSFAIEVIQKDLNTLRNNKVFKIQEPYIKLLESAERKALEERKELKQKMYRGKLKVYQTGKSKHSTEYTFFGSGKQDKHDFDNAVLRNHTMEVLEELFKGR